MKFTNLAYLALSFVLIGCTESGSDELTVIGGETGQCSIEKENQLLFDYLQDKYFWNTQLPASVDYKEFATSSALLAAVVAPQDRFSFITTKQEYDDRYVNATYFGFGMSSESSPDKQSLLVRYVFDNSPSDQALLQRGDKIVAIDNKSVADWLAEIEAGQASYEDMHGPNEAGIARTYQWQQQDGSLRTQQLVKTSVKTNSVLHQQVFNSEQGKVGYLVVKEFVQPTEQELITAFKDFSAQSVQELVLDLRYNGGGLIQLANQLASQLAWNQVKNKTFLQYKYNSKNSGSNKTFNFSLGSASDPLNLTRVFILTSAATCSASEMLINALSPFVDVVSIGAKTCGKPYGMHFVQICDKVVTAVNFQTFNALGQGDFLDGLAVECEVTDFVNGNWGALTDPLLAEAMQYIQTNQCSANLTTQGKQHNKLSQSPLWKHGKVGTNY
ncbi:MAG: carboxyl-terminal protease [Gammaproteobacteria bacterium]|nr:carboxyl-terminal protease [Gammaproteobacteria bacterium]MBU2057409.1 carboxyl-terminal protease [Gammaproteobacteria bacterium]MBU2176863.1 carboxyl-terminal protease [Gammaproteobacteria bacterium]MBU2247975.1 carboxyl-terminal protease [Gammaproteobacteria bacterium]MBU2346378.1 carboxyl-terminal protease [Gammaproteobacteria bacterium]